MCSHIALPLRSSPSSNQCNDRWHLHLTWLQEGLSLLRRHQGLSTLEDSNLPHSPRRT
ncbi:hypothetical protein GIB67_001079 [Kingdonia uniflora]|uniref:Uncharacterized protein n=1 Tax=Kingdonia uniflora TaxID=39325 RepID=A0A7J7MG34_9MAGN|nr:hypothetical protein GIB67_001079 [Kingdonia uniflora]